MERHVHHVVRILDQSGDTKLIYDPTDSNAVRTVEDRFTRLMEANFVAFDVSKNPGRVITAFDPDATEIIVSPRFSGG